MRRRRKRNKSPKVMNLSSVLDGMEVDMRPLSYSTLLYTESAVYERFVKFCQIKSNYANGWMLEWEYKRPARQQAGTTPVPLKANSTGQGEQDVYQSFVQSVRHQGRRN